MNTNNYNSSSAINPYFFGKPISQKELLYGREDTIKQIKYNLTNNIKITLLEVQRRIGKSSLLKCLPEFMTESEGDFKFVNFSFQGMQNEEIPTILDDVAEQIIEDIGGIPEQEKELVNNLDTFFGYFLPKIINQYLSNEKVVFLLDEFDILGEDEETYTQGIGKDLFEQLKKAVERENRLFAILVFGKPVKKITYLQSFLEQESKQSVIKVKELDRKNTEKLIREPAKGTLEYEHSAIETIWQLSAGHPSLTQVICFNIFRYCRAKRIDRVTAYHVYLILNQVMKQGEVILDGFLKPLDKNEKLFFSAVAEAQEKNISDPLEIVKTTREITIPVLRQAGKRLVEYGFLEEKDTGYKIKVELVRLWLLKNYPLSSILKPAREPNQVSKMFSLLLVFGLVGGTTVFTTSQIIASRDNRRPRNDCASLLEEINAANNEERQLQVIQKVRADWSRETETLDEKCPYPITVGLDAEYDRLVHRYGWNKIKSQEYGKATEVWCEVSNNYEDFSEIESELKRWIFALKRIPNEDKEKVIKTLIEQNQSPNDCPAYSFTNKSNENLLYEQLNKLYYQKALDYVNNYEFGRAVELYCQITEDYEDFDDVVEQLKEWFNTEDYSDDFNENNQNIVREKVTELENQCPASPLN